MSPSPKTRRKTKKKECPLAVGIYLAGIPHIQLQTVQEVINIVTKSNGIKARQHAELRLQCVDGYIDFVMDDYKTLPLKKK